MEGNLSLFSFSTEFQPFPSSCYSPAKDWNNTSWDLLWIKFPMTCLLASCWWNERPATHLIKDGRWAGCLEEFCVLRSDKERVPVCPSRGAPAGVRQHKFPQFTSRRSCMSGTGFPAFIGDISAAWPVGGFQGKWRCSLSSQERAQKAFFSALSHLDFPLAVTGVFLSEPSMQR